MCENQESSLYHLASILWPPHIDRQSAIFLMLTLAFDAGGDKLTDYLTVAGFASSVEDWDTFSIKWQERLDREGISFFRAVDANNFRGPFEHWRELPEPNRVKLRENLFRDLMGLIHSHTYQKFSSTIVNKDYANTDNAGRREFAECAYSFAARDCEQKARRWLKEDPYWRSCRHMKVSCVFELGDEGQANLRDRLRKDRGNMPANFRPKLDTPREDGEIEHAFIPLQAADWLAWEINRATRDSYGGKIHSEADMRWPMRQFFSRPSPFMGIHTSAELKASNDMIKLINRIPDLAEALTSPQEIVKLNHAKKEKKYGN